VAENQNRPSQEGREAQISSQGNDAHLVKLDRLRQQKADVLRARGVPEKHFVDIKAGRFDHIR